MSSLLETLNRAYAAIPPWVEIVVCGYLAVVLGQQAIDRLRERRGVILVIVFAAIGVLCLTRAVNLLLAYM